MSDPSMRILAGDIGGTKSNLALFEVQGSGELGPPTGEEVLRGADFASFESMIDAYRTRHPEPVLAASFGVAGPVIGGHVRGTHMAWEIDSGMASGRLGIPAIHLINDLAATGYAVPALRPDDVILLKPGEPDPAANVGLVAAGTGLGETLLARFRGELVPIESEGGHADFAPRTDEEVALFLELRELFGRVSVERVLSGPGLVHVARRAHRGEGATTWARHEAAASEDDLPAAISEARLEGSCEWCRRALDLFVAVYGAEAGNLALRGVTRGGMYLGGGIAPKILPALDSDTFRDAFLDKAPHRELLETIPVWVIRNDRAAVLGAARYATLVGAPGP